jgi:hypothetical protein
LVISFNLFASSSLAASSFYLPSSLADASTSITLSLFSTRDNLFSNSMILIGNKN